MPSLIRDPRDATWARSQVMFAAPVAAVSACNDCLDNQHGTETRKAKVAGLELLACECDCACHKGVTSA